jgi:hypothetical protein
MKLTIVGSTALFITAQLTLIATAQAHHPLYPKLDDAKCSAAWAIASPTGASILANQAGPYGEEADDDGDGMISVEEFKDACADGLVKPPDEATTKAVEAQVQQQTISDQELMTDLRGSAPEGVVEGATIMNMGTDGKMKVVKEGNNGWTCMDPGGAPMCADQSAMKWVQAWQKKEPTPNKTGFIYMLKGDRGTSNTDPYAKEETVDNNWVKTGPHVMMVGAAKDMMQAYPRDAKPDPTKPYVMWPGTPYEHLMLPVQ